MPFIHTVAISSAVSVAVKGREWQLTLGLPRIMVGARENEQVAVRIGLAQLDGSSEWQRALGSLSGMDEGSSEWCTW